MNDKVLFSVTFNYLRDLDNPHETITENVWRKLVNEFQTFENVEGFNYLLNCEINRIAPHFGVLWRNKKDEKLNNILNQKFADLNKKHIGVWRIKGITLISAGLASLEEYEVTKLADKLYQPTSKEKRIAECDYDRIRININKYLTKQREMITNDNYEDIVKGLIKTFGKSLLKYGDFYNVDFKTYIYVLYKRFFEMKTYLEISEEMGVQTGQINNIINKFVNECDEAFDNLEERVLLCKKFENFYNAALEELDSSNLKERNERLDILKRFQKYFIAEHLANYIR